MVALFKSLVLQVTKVPAEPHVPAGSPGSEKTFRAAENYFALQVCGWLIRQLFTAIVLTAFIVAWHLHLAPHLPAPLTAFITVAKVFAVVLFIVQLPFTYALTRLDYEMRWYIVTDRSLRIRAGVWSVREMTMTFANIQQISVHQGPVQRIFGIYDLEVTTAGGAGHGHSGIGAGRFGGTSAHQGFFHGIGNAPEVRDLILDRLRRYRDAGLGDPEEAHHEAHHETHEGAVVPASALSAAQEVLHEARSLRQALR